KLVNKYTPRNIWDFPDAVDVSDIASTSTEVPILQEANSLSFQLWVELLEIENIRFHQEDVEPDEVDNIDYLICQTRIVTPNDFLVNDDEFENDTLEEYNDEEVELDDDSNTSSEEENGISNIVT
ncbi:hypothetical protein PanWU01x14_337060, partial [Parasponia andersonii]